MIIANPIYDIVFKRLMENERIAKFLISTLLNQKVISIQFRPQEYTYEKELIGLRIFRLDFIALIETEKGERKKILIEIQKAHQELDLMRFRNYLAEQYKKEDKFKDKEEVLPITTIYILGFNLPEIDSACFQVERNYKDLVNNKILKNKSYFVERLTHDGFFIQVKKIGKRYQTSLDKLLSIFEQRNFVEDNEILKDYNYDLDLEEVKMMTDILQESGADAATRKEIKDEKEAWRTLNALTGEPNTKFKKALVKLEEKEKTIKEKNKTLKENEKTLKEKDKTLKEKDKTLKEKDKLIEELKRKLENR